MSENNPNSLDALFNASPDESQDANQADLPQAEDVEIATANAVAEGQQQDEPQDGSGETTDENEAPKSDEPDPVEELRQQMAKLEERHSDTRKWGNEANRKYLAAMKKLQELGELSADEEAAVAELEKQNNPNQDVDKDFFTRFNPVAEYLKAQGEDPDELLSAFKFAAQTTPQLQQEFMELEPEKRVAFALSKARESMDMYKSVKETGSVAAAMAKMREKVKEEVMAELAATAGVAKQETSKPKDRTRNLSGGNAPSTEAYKAPGLAALMSN